MDWRIGSGDRIDWIRHARKGEARTAAEATEFSLLRDPGLEDVAALEAPIVVLLGEPGMGKTDVSRQWALRHTANQMYTGDLLHEHPPPPTDPANRPLPIVVDALDEHPGGVAEALRTLSAWGRFEAGAPRLWLTCRSASWTHEHARMLPADRLGVWTIAPLTEDDVRASARRTADPDRFLEAIRRNRLERFANRPLTLDLLLELHGRGALPDESARLYELACRRMCNDDERLLIVAGRLAAWMMFTQRTTAGATGALKLSEVAGLEPQLDRFDAQGAVAQADLEHLLNSSPLLRPADGAARWAHASFAEFLAARYVAHDLQRRGQWEDSPALQTLRVQSLFAHPRGGLVPQLAEVASWLGSLLGEGAAREAIVDLDPIAQLQGDLHLRSDEEKLRVAREFLSRCEAGRGDERSQRSHFWKLASDGLADLIRPYLLDSTHDWVARRAAIDIAGGARVEGVLDTLVHLALDVDEVRYHLRTQAAWAVLHSGSRQHIAGLRQLLVEPGDDPDDDLRGVALTALHESGLIDIVEVFEHLGFRKRLNYFGALEGLIHHLARSVDEWFDVSSLKSFVDWWLAPRPARPESQRFYEDRGGGGLFNALLSVAIGHIDQPLVANQIVRVLPRLHRRQGQIFVEVLADAPHLWGPFLDACALAAIEPRRFWLEWELDPSLPQLAAALREAGPSVRSWLLGLLEFRGYGPLAPGVEALLGLYLDHPDDFPELRHLHIVDLESDEADVHQRALQKHLEGRAEHEALMAERRARDERRKSEKEERERAVQAAMDNPSPIVESRLEMLRSGRLEWFPDLLNVLLLGGEERPMTSDWRAGLEQAHGWRTASDARRAEVLKFALLYLDQDPRTNEWFVGDSTPWDAIAGAAAIHLLCSAGRGDEIEPEHWQRWAPAIIRGHSAISKVMVDRIREHASATLADVLFERAQADAYKPLSLLISLRDLGNRWPALIRDVCARLIPLYSLDPRKRGIACARIVCLDRASVSLVLTQLEAVEDDETWVELAGGAAQGAPAEIWPSVAGKVYQMPLALARRVLALANDQQTRDDRFLQHLTTAALGDLLKWLEDRITEDVRQNESSSGFQLTWFPQLIIDTLKQRSEPESVDALRRAGQRWAADEVEARLLANAWRPFVPTELAHTLSEPLAIRLNTAAQLRSWLVEVARRAYASADAARLWQRVLDDRWRPVDTRAVIDFLGTMLPRTQPLTGFIGCELAADDDARLRVTFQHRDAVRLAVDVDVRPNWSERLTEPYPDLLLIPWFAGPSWTRLYEVDQARRERAMRHRREEVERVLRDGSVLPVAAADLRDTIARSLPWFDALEAAITRESMELDEWVSIGSPDCWMLRLRLPDRLRDRFGLSEQVTLVARDPRLDERSVRLVLDEVRVAPPRVDPFLIIGVSPSFECDVAAWRAPDFPPLADVLAAHPLDEDIFDSRVPVRGEHLLGRVDDVEALTKAIARGDWLLISGLRMSGKSSLVMGAEDRLAGRVLFSTVNLDVVALKGRTEPSLAHAIGSTLGEPQLVSFIDLQAKIGQLLGLPDRRVCLVLDEFDNLVRGPSMSGQAVWEGGLQLLLGLGALRHQHPGRLSVVFVGRHPEWLLAPRLDGHANPLTGHLGLRPIRPFDRADVDRVLNGLGRRVGLRFCAEHLDACHEWTGGHALMVRLWGSATYEICRERGVSSTEPIDVDDIVDRWLERGVRYHFVDEVVEYLESSDPRALQLLAALAAHEPEALARHGGRRGGPLLLLKRLGVVMGPDLRPPRVIAEFISGYVREDRSP